MMTAHHKWYVETVGHFSDDEELMDYVRDRFGIDPVDIPTIADALYHLQTFGLDVKQVAP